MYVCISLAYIIYIQLTLEQRSFFFPLSWLFIPTSDLIWSVCGVKSNVEESQNIKYTLLIYTCTDQLKAVYYLIPSHHSPGKSCYFAHWCRKGRSLCCCCIHCNNEHTHTHTSSTQLKSIREKRAHSVLKPQRGFGKLHLVIMLPNNPCDCKCLFWFTVYETKGN